LNDQLWSGRSRGVIITEKADHIQAAVIVFVLCKTQDESGLFYRFTDKQYFSSLVTV
jgi:hypothetical protein